MNEYINDFISEENITIDESKLKEAISIVMKRSILEDSMIDTFPPNTDVIDYNNINVMEDEEVSSLVEMINKLERKYIPNWNDISGVTEEPDLFNIGMHSSYFPMEIEEDKLVLIGVSNSN